MTVSAQLRKKQEAALPASPTAQKPVEEKPVETSIPAPPDYRKEVFKGSRLSEWEEFNTTLEKREDLSPAERRIMRDIFAAEGGRDSHKDTNAFAGVLPSTLEDHIKQNKVPNIIAKHGRKPNNTDLDSNDLVEIYKSHLNSMMSSAIKGYEKDNAGKKADATKLLSGLNDKVGSAVADTLFKNKDGVRSIQEAINKRLPQNEKTDIDGVYGSKTQKILEGLSKDPQESERFLKVWKSYASEKKVRVKCPEFIIIGFVENNIIHQVYKNHLYPGRKQQDLKVRLIYP